MSGKFWVAKTNTEQHSDLNLNENLGRSSAVGQVKNIFCHLAGSRQRTKHE